MENGHVHGLPSFVAWVPSACRWHTSGRFMSSCFPLDAKRNEVSFDSVAAEELDRDCLVCCQVDETGRAAGFRLVLRGSGWQGFYMRPELVQMWKASQR